MLKLPKEIKDKIKDLKVVISKVEKHNKNLELIVEESKSLNSDKISEEVLIWLTKNVENFISNQETKFKIDLILDKESETLEDMEEIKKLQDLYSAIPEDDEMSKKELERSFEVRTILNKITSDVFEKINSKDELLNNLFKRMAYYYELKGINKGKMLIQELTGKVSILNFEYEAFSVGVKIRNAQTKDTVKQYMIPEGFTLWLEIAFTAVSSPQSIF